MRPRLGFTLIEVLIAVVLIDVGLLALVACGAVLVAQTNELKARAAAMQAATNRIQLLGIGPCAAGTGSEVGERGVREQWSVAPAGNGIRDIGDSVNFLAGGRPRSVVLRTRLPC
jgi:Tfp pilus assembly protein PilV